MSLCHQKNSAEKVGVICFVLSLFLSAVAAEAIPAGFSFIEKEMVGVIDENAVLDYVVFHSSTTQNCYEAIAYSKDGTETIASGPLDQLAFHLPEAKRFLSSPSNTSFTLKVTDSQKGSSWFTKFTLARFFHIVNVPEALKATYAIEKEMSQLEETRKFHLFLYSKDPDQLGGGTTDVGLNEIGLNHQIKVETASSHSTKNEFLRTLHLRITALKEELACSFNQAAGTSCSRCQISSLEVFAQHFGVTDLRKILLKLLAWMPEDLPSDPSCGQLLSSQNSRNAAENMMKAIPGTITRNNEVKSPINVVSPAEIARAERESSSESEKSFGSTSEDQSHTARSRPLVRSASPRRSASPMRRIQIGRSGSRRSTALTIKSLGYFPARERNIASRDVDGSNSGDEQPSLPPKKLESQANPVRSISVQDAISLFERKQKDQDLDIKKTRATGEVSASTTTRSVLRRWSAGMGDSFAHCSQDTTSEGAPQNTEHSKVEEAVVGSSNFDESPQVVGCSSEDLTLTSPQVEIPEPVIPKVEEICERATASADWSQQKEAELNQMLMKLMENKPGKDRVNPDGGSREQQDVSAEQKGGFYRQYVEKRDEKLQAGNDGKRTSRETQFKATKETLDQSKAKMTSKPGSFAGKRDSSTQPQKPRRNSAPPVLPKKEVSKTSATSKGPPKTSPLPATRKSWSAGPLPRATGAPASKMSPNLRKSQQTPSPTQPGPRTEKLFKQTEVVKKVNPADVKPSLKEKPTDVKPSPKGQEEKKARVVTKNSKILKTKSLTTPTDDSVTVSAKPFYNKITKKGSVVPLESKPFMRKGTGLTPRVAPVVAKSKVSQSDESSKISGNLIQTEENESSTVVTAEPTSKGLENDLEESTSSVDAHTKDLTEKDPSHVDNNDFDQNSKTNEFDNGFKNVVEDPVPEIPADEDLGISSAAWVEIECREGSSSRDNGVPEIATSPGLVPAMTLSSPKVHHSLSQMLQADTNEPEILEWGNAEIPPALIYQKDAPKGLKRLLKFARKSKGDGNATGWASSSLFSEGEDDTEESKAASKRSSDAILSKAAFQAKNYEPPKTVLTASFDGGNSSKGSMDYRGVHDVLPAQSGTSVSTISDKLQELQSSASSTSGKATRSFFSRSTFRSTKSTETKLR